MTTLEPLSSTLIKSIFDDSTIKLPKSIKELILELDKHIQINNKIKDILNLDTLTINDIVEKCQNIEDSTEINFNSINESNILDEMSKGKFGEGIYKHIPVTENTKFNIPEKEKDMYKNGIVSPSVHNSPEYVCYMANLFSYFFTNVIKNPEKKNKILAVGGIFPSFFLNQQLKDFDFAIVTKIDNIRLYMRYIVIYFTIFVAIAQSIGKLPPGNIIFKEDSPRKDVKDIEPDLNIHNNEKYLNFNVRIDINGFEGIDLVLLRNITSDNNEVDIDNPYNGETKDDETNLCNNIYRDSIRRETYLNIMYGAMQVDDRYKSVIVVSDYFLQQTIKSEFAEEYIKAFTLWEHSPTAGLNTFTASPTSLYRVNRILKMYLKKYFDPKPSLDILDISKESTFKSIFKNILIGYIIFLIDIFYFCIICQIII